MGAKNSNFFKLLSLENKTEQAKIDILRIFATNGNSSISDIAKATSLSVPTVTKFIADLMEEGYLIDYGKQETTGGRKPNVYGLNPASGYFVGVDLRRHSLSIGVINFYGELVFSQFEVPYLLSDTMESLNELCSITREVILQSSIPYEKIAAFGFNITGRVDSEKGVSHNYFFNETKSLTKLLEERLEHKVYIDNDSRAMCYGEYVKTCINGERNVLFINVSWGLGSGMVLDGKLYYGTSGFSGEFGHVSFFDNEIFCHCGKKGCMETEASGSAMHRLLLAKHQAGARSILSSKLEKKEIIRTEDMVRAALQEDILMIEIIEEIGSKLGKGIAGLINIFNPQLVIIGGIVSGVGDYLILPIQSAIKKYSLNLVNKDTTVRCSELKDSAGIIGACFIARNRVLGIL